MNTKIALIVVAVAVLVPGMYYVSLYNGLVYSAIEVDEKWAQVQVQYQRRYDLIPQIINATKLYISYEQALLVNITQARSAWTNSLEGSVEEQIEANEGLDSVFNRLLSIVVVEDYPDLSADTLVLTLIDELEGTENRIAVARLQYNEAVTEYNSKTKLFPSSIVADMNGYTERPYYEASSGADQSPTV